MYQVHLEYASQFLQQFATCCLSSVYGALYTNHVKLIEVWKAAHKREYTFLRVPKEKKNQKKTLDTHAQ